MHQTQLFDIDTPNEAIDFIRLNYTDGEAFVGFSGGKDSIVTAELMRLSGVPHRLYYSATGLDAPEVVRFIRHNYPECVFLHPHRTFWNKLAAHSPPSDRLRWCCSLLKKDPSWKVPCKQRFMGIRAEESVRRAKQGRINQYWQKTHGATDFYPIYHWKEWQIWDFIKDHRLKVPPLYDWGFDRIGCVLCPYHSEITGKKHAMYRQRWPHIFNKWERGISELWLKRQDQGKHMFNECPEDFIAAWYLDDSTRWYAR